MESKRELEVCPGSEEGQQHPGLCEQEYDVWKSVDEAFIPSYSAHHI